MLNTNEWNFTNRVVGLNAGGFCETVGQHILYQNFVHRTLGERRVEAELKPSWIRWGNLELGMLPNGASKTSIWRARKRMEAMNIITTQEYYSNAGGPFMIRLELPALILALRFAVSEMRTVHETSNSYRDDMFDSLNGILRKTERYWISKSWPIKQAIYTIPPGMVHA